MQHLKWSPLTGLQHWQTTVLQKNMQKETRKTWSQRTSTVAMKIYLVLKSYLFMQDTKFTMYKMRRRTKVPYTCDKSTQFSSQTVDCKFSCQRLSTTKQYCAETALLMACASLESEHTNISGFIAEIWISICYIGHQGEWTQITIETENPPNRKVKFKSYSIQ